MDSNVNISPDMIENLINMLRNSNSSSNDYSFSNDKNGLNNSENLDHSDNQRKTDSVHSSDSSDLFSSIDFETIIKLKSIIDSLNSTNNQDSKLLYSLKPYLRKSRQDKLEQYINILKISQVSKLFKKGDVK